VIARSIATLTEELASPQTACDSCVGLAVASGPARTTSVASIGRSAVLRTITCTPSRWPGMTHTTVGASSGGGMSATPSSAVAGLSDVRMRKAGSLSIGIGTIPAAASGRLVTLPKRSVCRRWFDLQVSHPSIKTLREHRVVRAEFHDKLNSGRFSAITIEHAPTDAINAPVGTAAQAPFDVIAKMSIDCSYKGDVQVHPVGPQPVSYRAIVPRDGECENLLVPVCLSASHVAYGSVRMEPVFMVLAQSAAEAARRR